MDVAQDLSQEQDALADEVMNNVGIPDSETPDVKIEGDDEQELPKGVKERLGRQEKRHQKELRHLRAQLEAMHGQLNQPPRYQQQTESVSSHDTGGIDEQIHKAVSYALAHKDMQERQAKEEEHKAHVSRQYMDLQNHLDDMAEKYDDFHDVVLGNDIPFTSHMRDFAVTLPKNGPGSAGEVLYKLGKNREELHRISKLHPIDQVSEMIKLSHAALAGSNDQRASGQAKQMGQLKSNPVSNMSQGVTDKTSISDLRRRMRSGWK